MLPPGLYIESIYRVFLPPPRRSYLRSWYHSIPLILDSFYTAADSFAVYQSIALTFGLGGSGVEGVISFFLFRIIHLLFREGSVPGIRYFVRLVCLHKCHFRQGQ